MAVLPTHSSRTTILFLYCEIPILFLKRYNEEGSDIYDDANTLERVLMTKVKELAVEYPNLVSLKKTISAVGEKYSSHGVSPKVCCVCCVASHPARFQYRLP